LAHFQQSVATKRASNGQTVPDIAASLGQRLQRADKVPSIFRPTWLISHRAFAAAPPRAPLRYPPSMVTLADRFPAP
jgi:hypothetical protein